MFKITPSRLFYAPNNKVIKDKEKIYDLIIDGKITKQEAVEYLKGITHDNALTIEKRVNKAKETRKINKITGSTATRRTLNKVDDASAIIAKHYIKNGLKPFFITLTTPIRNKEQSFFKKAVSAFIENTIKNGYFEPLYVIVYEIQDGKKSNKEATNEIHAHILICSNFDYFEEKKFKHITEIWRNKLRIIYGTSKTINGNESSSCHIETTDEVSAILGYFKKQKITNDIKKQKYIPEEIKNSAKKIGIIGRNYSFSQQIAKEINQATFIISSEDATKILQDKTNILQVSKFTDKYDNEYYRYKHNLILTDKYKEFD